MCICILIQRDACAAAGWSTFSAGGRQPQTCGGYHVRSQGIYVSILTSSMIVCRAFPCGGYHVRLKVSTVYLLEHMIVPTVLLGIRQRRYCVRPLLMVRRFTFDCAATAEMGVRCCFSCYPICSRLFRSVLSLQWSMLDVAPAVVLAFGSATDTCVLYLTGKTRHSHHREIEKR